MFKVSKHSIIHYLLPLVQLSWLVFILLFPFFSWSQCVSGEDCPPPIMGFSSRQMTVNGIQTLTASGGGGGPYIWSITSGAGTLSGTSGISVVYTAPSSNPNCLNNPVITVTDNYTSGLTNK
jgi:hypothetical protein